MFSITLTVTTAIVAAITVAVRFEWAALGSNHRAGGPGPECRYAVPPSARTRGLGLGVDWRGPERIA